MHSTSHEESYFYIFVFLFTMLLRWFPLRYYATFQLSGQVNPTIHWSSICNPSVPQSAGFQACLCDRSTENPEEYLLILRCFPIHMRSEVEMSITTKHTVAFQVEDTAKSYLSKDDQAFFTLPDELTPGGETDIENSFIR